MMPRYLKYGWKRIQEEDSVIPLRPFCASAQVKIELDIACEKAAGAQIANLNISKLISYIHWEEKQVINIYQPVNLSWMSFPTTFAHLCPPFSREWMA